MVSMLRGGERLSTNELADRLYKQFAHHERSALLTTCRVQCGGRLRKDRNLNVQFELVLDPTIGRPVKHFWIDDASALASADAAAA